MTADKIVSRLIDQVWSGGDLAALGELFADPFDHGGKPDTVASLRAWHANDTAVWADQRRG